MLQKMTQVKARGGARKSDPMARNVPAGWVPERDTGPWNARHPEHLLCAKHLRLHTSPLNFTASLQETSYLYATKEELTWRGPCNLPKVHTRKL